MSLSPRLALLPALILITGLVCIPHSVPVAAQTRADKITVEQDRSGRGTITPTPIGTPSATIPLASVTDTPTPTGTTATDTQTLTSTDTPLSPTPDGTLAATAAGTTAATASTDVPTATPTIVPTFNVSQLPPPPPPPANPPTSTPTSTPTPTLLPPPTAISLAALPKRKGQRLQIAIGGRLRLARVADLIVLVRGSRHHKQVRGAYVVFDGRDVGLRGTRRGWTDKNGIVRFRRVRPARQGFVYLTASKHHFGSGHRHWAIKH